MAAEIVNYMSFLVVELIFLIVGLSLVLLTNGWHILRTGPIFQAVQLLTSTKDSTGNWFE
jgi:hypothetical protein